MIVRWRFQTDLGMCYTVSMRLLLILLISLYFNPVFGKELMLIVGDSLSSGDGIELNQSWPNLLLQQFDQQDIDLAIVNLSSSGNTTLDGIQIIQDANLQYQPQWTIIALGGNDGLQGLPIQTIYHNLSQMIELCLSYKQHVIVIAMTLPPNWGPKYIEQFELIYQQLKAQYPQIDLVEFSIDDFLGLLQSDGIHPTQEAQHIIQKRVFLSIQKIMANEE